jgi:hypothetical protein
MPSTSTTCARCGRPVEPGEHLCAQCREEVGPAATTGQSASAPTPAGDPDQQERQDRWPATMVRPSPVQYHATIFLTVALVLVGLGVWAFIAHHGVGPFDANVRSRSAYDRGAQTIVVAVTNQGSRSSRATCTFRALDGSDVPIATTTVLTDPIPSHTTVDVTQVFRGLSTQPAAYDTVCT